MKAYRVCKFACKLCILYPKKRGSHIKPFFKYWWGRAICVYAFSLRMFSKLFWYELNMFNTGDRKYYSKIAMKCTKRLRSSNNKSILIRLRSRSRCPSIIKPNCIFSSPDKPKPKKIYLSRKHQVFMTSQTQKHPQVNNCESCWWYGFRFGGL